MADVIKEYAIKISIEGNKAVIKEFKNIDKQVEKGTKNLDKQNKALNKTNSLLWTYAKRLVGIYAIYRMIRKGIDLGVGFAEQGNSLKNMSTIANISARSLQKWGVALRKFGGDEKSVASTMASIQQKLYSQKFGEEPFKDFVERYYRKGDIGILKSKNAEEFLLNVARKMEQYTSAEDKLGIGRSLGLDETMIEFLMQGYKEVSQQLKNAGVLFSDKDIDNAVKAKQAMIDFNYQMAQLGNLLAGKIIPYFTDFVKELTSFLQDPKKYIANALEDRPTSQYGVAKDMFNPATMGKWIKDRLYGLSDWSATTGLLTSPAYHLLGKIADSNINVNNNINMNITGSNADEIAEKSGNAITNIDGKSISTATERQAGGII